MKIKSECLEELFNAKIVCEEHKQKIIFINRSKKQIFKIRVDGCQITNGKRCDFLVLNSNDHDEHFVELKGSDIKYAIAQLAQSIKILGDKNNTKYSYIISNRCPISSAELQVERLKFRKVNNSDLIIKNNRYEVKL